MDTTDRTTRDAEEALIDFMLEEEEYDIFFALDLIGDEIGVSPEEIDSFAEALDPVHALRDNLSFVAPRTRMHILKNLKSGLRWTDIDGNWLLRMKD